MKIEEKQNLKIILERFSDKLFERFYITNPPQIVKSDNINMGYGNGVIKPQQSIHFGFKTTKPNEDDIKTLIKVFIESESW
ncbi:MAG: hypothetical protein QF842_04800 [Candidatus Marinimicrobia bacterium]|jgi:hypothetical protein|nr:hypothetical protein [Candidatus Neomarinimicrobiota bacterium]|tara:strand:- start:710 stop:952 length:243 start_codon:yes stop_codon:yes gene_type:complete